MKTGIIYSVGLYQRGMVIRGSRVRELNVEAAKASGGKRQSVIKSP